MTASLVAGVAVGGAVGALARFGLVEAFPDRTVTLVINVVGSFLLGVLIARRADDVWARAVLGTGVLGGFTTFSALAVQAVEAPVVTGALYVLLTLGLGLGAARLGLRLG